MPKEVKMPLWNGKRIAKDDDTHDLERRAATYEFKHRMNRHDAEHRAHHEYRQEKHKEAAAYHLAGLKAAQASGSHEDAHKHGMMYQLHLKEIGLDPVGPVPTDVGALMEKLDRFYKFKPHHGDAFLLQDEGSPTPVAKSESLAKGNVVAFPKDRVTPPADQGKPAPVLGRLYPQATERYVPKEGEALRQVVTTPRAQPKKSPVAGRRVAGSPKPLRPPVKGPVAQPGGRIDVGDYLARTHGSRALDDEGDYSEVLHGLARHYNVHPDVIDQELKRHQSRALDDDEDLGHVIVEMNRHLNRHFAKNPNK